MKLQKNMIFDEFVLQSKLGEGGMGEVWLANYTSIDMQVALKILPFTDDQDDIDRFNREVRMQGMLNHRSIVKAIKAGYANNHHYFAMNLVNGKDLNYWLKDGVLSERDSLKIVLDIAKAMYYAWSEHRLTHRDIKPSNIMVDDKFNIYLMDLGLSKLVDSANDDLTLTGAFLGTPHYMSPEQARSSEDLDQRSDIYSLGATLYKMLTGHYVFESDNDNLTDLLTKLALDDHKAASDLEPDLSGHIDTLIDGMLQKSMNIRYQSWTSLIKDIQLVLDNEKPRNRYRVKETSIKFQLALKADQSKAKVHGPTALIRDKKSINKAEQYNNNYLLKKRRNTIFLLTIALMLSVFINVFFVFINVTKPIEKQNKIMKIAND